MLMPVMVLVILLNLIVIIISTYINGVITIDHLGALRLRVRTTVVPQIWTFFYHKDILIVPEYNPMGWTLGTKRVHQPVQWLGVTVGLVSYFYFFGSCKSCYGNRCQFWKSIVVYFGSSSYLHKMH